MFRNGKNNLHCFVQPDVGNEWILHCLEIDFRNISFPIIKVFLYGIVKTCFYFLVFYFVSKCYHFYILFLLLKFDFLMLKITSVSITNWLSELSSPMNMTSWPLLFNSFEKWFCFWLETNYTAVNVSGKRAFEKTFGIQVFNLSHISHKYTSRHEIKF